jgi:hypothetical protein
MDRNRSLLVLLTSAIACGGLAPVSDAGGPDGATDATIGDASGQDVVFIDPDGSTMDAPADTGVDGCPSGWTPYDGGCYPPSPRRPFLVGASLRMAAPRDRRDWAMRVAAAPEMPEATRRALADAWLRDALEEHASIAAFARFTMMLLSAGAPPGLVARAQRASIDELQHARACFALAGRYARQGVGPAELRVDDAIPTTLEEMVVLTAEEGCVGETLGALLATHQSKSAKDLTVRAILEKIVRDETRHADLAWRFTAWAIAVGGERIAQAARAAIERACAKTVAMPLRSYDDVDLDIWHAHGRVTCEEARTIVKDGIRDVIEPCLQLLTTDRPSTRDARASFSA